MCLNDVNLCNSGYITFEMLPQRMRAHHKKQSIPSFEYSAVILTKTSKPQKWYSGQP